MDWICDWLCGVGWYVSVRMYVTTVCVLCKLVSKLAVVVLCLMGACALGHVGVGNFGRGTLRGFSIEVFSCCA